MGEFLLDYGDTEHPKRKSESDFPERWKKIPQKFSHAKVFKTVTYATKLFD